MPDINGWEVLATGTYHDGDITLKDSDLDEIVKTHSKIGALMKPFLKLGHDTKQKLIQQQGWPSAGWITNVRKAGNKLLVDVKDIPEKIFSLIKKRAYGRVSSELTVNKLIEGTTYPMALKAVALLGADTPEIKSLDDFIKLYWDEAPSLVLAEDEGETLTVEYSEKVWEGETDPVIKQHKEPTMDYQKMYEDERQKNLQLAEEKAAEEKKVETAEAATADAVKEGEEKVAAEEKKTEAAEEKVAEGEKEAAEKDTEDKVDELCEKAVEKGTIKPALVPILKAIALSVKVDGKEQTYTYAEGDGEKEIKFTSSTDLVEQLINSSGEIELSEKSKKGKDAKGKDKADGNDGEKDDPEFAEKVNEKIAEAKKAGNDLSFSEAMKEVAIEEEVG